MEVLNLLESSQLQERTAHVILTEMNELLNVSFTTETQCSNMLCNKKQTDSVDTDIQMESAMFSLSKFHAACEAYDKLKWKTFDLKAQQNLIVQPFGEKNFIKIYTLILKYLNEIKDIYPHTFLDDISSQDVEIKFDNIWKELSKFGYKKILINGDYSHHNIVFNDIKTVCTMKDFSHAAYESPLFDIFQYVSSISTEINWNLNIKKAKEIYYEFLHKHMKKFNINTSTIFPPEEYEDAYKLLYPIMKIIFHLKPRKNKQYFELSEILNILNLNPNTTPSLISFEDCYMVCRNLKINNFYMSTFQTKLQEGQNGFLGEHHDMTIEIKRGEVKKFFLKGIPRSEALQEFEKTVGSFFKETMFYSRYIPLLKEYGIGILDNIVPECYFANEFKYIVLDNLRTYGFETLSPRFGMQNSVVLNAINILAKLNASCIILEELIERKTGTTFRLCNIFGKEFKEAFFSSEPVIESHRNAGAGGMVALTEIINFNDPNDFMFKILAEEACNEQVSLARPSQKWRNTLCHADFWTKNFMVKFDENRIVERIMMIDFQTYRYAPPAQDLMAFIYLNSTREVRGKYMGGWLDYYYEVFAENLQMYAIDVNSILPRKDFDESCMFYEQFAITQSITHFQVILIPSNIIGPMLEDQARAREIFLGSRYNLVKTVWPLDKIYRNRLTEAVEELRRCLIK